MKKKAIKKSMKRVIEEMEKGKESTQIIRDILLGRQRPRWNDDDENEEDYFKTLEHHSMLAFTSFVTSLTLLRNYDFDVTVNDEDLCVETSNHPTNYKDKRGCYKRRKIGEARMEEVTNLRDDGFGWRKYGQKPILNANYPRNYYRCTHKFDKDCPATKQVQQISDTPTKYRIIYHGKHICNHNILNQPPMVIVDDDESSQQHSSAIVLNFGKQNQASPVLFPMSSSASRDQTTTAGLSSSTIVSEQSDLVSTAEKFSATHQGEVDDDYNSVWTELDVLHDFDISFSN